MPHSYSPILHVEYCKFCFWIIVIVLLRRICIGVNKIIRYPEGQLTSDCSIPPSPTENHFGTRVQKGRMWKIRIKFLDRQTMKIGPYIQTCACVLETVLETIGFPKRVFCARLMLCTKIQANIAELLCLRTSVIFGTSNMAFFPHSSTFATTQALPIHLAYCLQASLEWSYMDFLSKSPSYSQAPRLPK